MFSIISPLWQRKRPIYANSPHQAPLVVPHSGRNGSPRALPPHTTTEKRRFDERDAEMSTMGPVYSLHWHAGLCASSIDPGFGLLDARRWAI